MKFVRALGTVLLVLGATIMLFVGYELIGTSIITAEHQRDLVGAWDQLLEGSAPGSPRVGPRLGVLGIARLRIPKIHLNMIVVEGVTIGELAYGPGHYRQTPPIGALGTTAIAGHRTGWGSPFIDFDKLGTGDAVYLDTIKATYLYRITNTTIVEANHVEVLNGDPASKATHKLTLTTCTPKYTAARRLIVWADEQEQATIYRGGPPKP